MLHLLIALALAPPVVVDPLVAVDVAGMEPQLSIIRSDVAARGWQISCVGRSGEETTIRVSFPSGTTEESVRAYFGPQTLGSTKVLHSVRYPPPPSCDIPSPIQSGTTPVRVLGSGPPDMVEPLVGLARACGYAGAALRVLRPDDLTPGESAPQYAWLVLDAGEDASIRYGPMVCWRQMLNRVQSPPVTQGH